MPPEGKIRTNRNVQTPPKRVRRPESATRCGRRTMTGIASTRVRKAARGPKTVITVATPPRTNVVIQRSPVSTLASPKYVLSQRSAKMGRTGAPHDAQAPILSSSRRLYVRALEQESIDRPDQ